MTILRHYVKTQEITELCENRVFTVANATVLTLRWDKEVLIPLGINFAMVKMKVNQLAITLVIRYIALSA